MLPPCKTHCGIFFDFFLSLSTPYVDKEHIIELEGHNAKIFFLEHSDSNALKQVKELLIDAYENRVCKGFVS